MEREGRRPERTIVRTVELGEEIKPFEASADTTRRSPYFQLKDHGAFHVYLHPLNEEGLEWSDFTGDKAMVMVRQQEKYVIQDSPALMSFNVDLDYDQPRDFEYNLVCKVRIGDSEFVAVDSYKDSEPDRKKAGLFISDENWRDLWVPSDPDALQQISMSFERE